MMMMMMMMMNYILCSISGRHPVIGWRECQEPSNAASSKSPTGDAHPIEPANTPASRTRILELHLPSLRTHGETKNGDLLWPNTMHHGDTDLFGPLFETYCGGDRWNSELCRTLL